jgi:hypothetical protein
MPGEETPRDNLVLGSFETLLIPQLKSKIYCINYAKLLHVVTITQLLSLDLESFLHVEIWSLENWVWDQLQSVDSS